MHKYDYLYLKHHGILGQKWGVRRYQNPDGTLTEAGMRRYQTGTSNKVSDISTVKGGQRRLNDLDKAIAFNKRPAKNIKRPEYFKGKMNEAIIEDNKIKYNNAKQNYDISSKFYKNYDKHINEGKKETEKLIKKLESNGNIVSLKNTYRTPLYNSEKALYAGMSFVGALLGLPDSAIAASIGYNIYNSRVEGTKYKVK